MLFRQFSSVTAPLMREDGNKEVEEAITFALESPYPNENELLDNVFKS